MPSSYFIFVSLWQFSQSLSGKESQFNGRALSLRQENLLLQKKPSGLQGQNMQAYLDKSGLISVAHTLFFKDSHSDWNIFILVIVTASVLFQNFAIVLI